MKKIISVVFVLLLVAMLFVSCSNGGGDKPDNSPAADPAQSADAQGGDKEVGEIAVIMQTLNGSFWSDVKRGVEKAIDELAEKGVKCSVNGPDDGSNLQAQVEMIEAAVAKKVSAIVIAPGDPVSVGSAMSICEEKNIPVVLINNSTDSKWPVCLVATDNYKLGELAGEALGKALGGKGLWAMINWNDSVVASAQRSAGAADYIKEHYPDMECYQMFYSYSVPDAELTFVRDTLTARKDFGGFITASEGQLTPTITAVEEAGRVGDIKIVSIDLSPVSLEYIRSGAVAAVSTQNPLHMGYTGTMTGYKVALGEEVPEYIDSGCALVDKDNMENDEEVRKILIDHRLIDA